jgi:glycosyltransferase involved in cell wall biosynthesis
MSGRDRQRDLTSSPTAMVPDPPAVTVLIGAYENAGTLPRAIASILEQTERRLELIVIDDGSADGSAAVAGEAIGSDPRGRVVRLERNVGIAQSLNAGLRAATAPLVAIQDADDHSASDRLERQLAVLAADQGVAVVGARMREVDAEGRVLQPRTTFAAGEVGPVLLRFNPIPNGCAAFRRDAALALGGYDPRYRYAAEYDLWLRIAERHRIVGLDEELCTRVMGRGNVAARAERAQIAEAIAIRVRALARRRTLRGAGGLARPALSYALPAPLKRGLRRRRGQAP